MAAARHLTAEMIYRARIMDDAARHVRECRRTRRCVWCDEPVATERVYPACEECREHRQVEAE